jgi:hypothetical protein
MVSYDQWECPFLELSKYCFVISAFHFVTLISCYCLLGKLLSKAQKIAYTLLNKVGNPREGTSIMLGDRVSRNSKHATMCSMI